MDIKDVDVRRAQLLETPVYGEAHRLETIARPSSVLLDIRSAALRVRRILRGVGSILIAGMPAILDVTRLGRNDHLVADAALLHPLADECLRGLVLVVVGGVDEVSACFVEGVEQLEAALLVHRAHADLVPLVADAHSAEAQRRDMDTGKQRELAMAA